MLISDLKLYSRDFLALGWPIARIYAVSPDIGNPVCTGHIASKDSVRTTHKLVFGWCSVYLKSEQGFDCPPGFGYTTYVLLRRNFTACMRDPGFLRKRLVTVTVCPLFVPGPGSLALDVIERYMYSMVGYHNIFETYV